MLDVLEHTPKFKELFEIALNIATQYAVVSLPNELFIADRLRLLAGKEHPAHSLDLLALPEGFKHQYLINIGKARRILCNSAKEKGYELSEEWLRPLLTKNKIYQPGLWMTRHLLSEELWSMGSIFIFKKVTKAK